jgi:acyl carrier protein
MQMVEESGFLEFVAGILDVPRESISLDTAYESIPEWDSVMQLRLTLEIGTEYNVEIPVDEIADIKTLGGFYKYVQG